MCKYTAGKNCRIYNSLCIKTAELLMNNIARWRLLFIIFNNFLLRNCRLNYFTTRESSKLFLDDFWLRKDHQHWRGSHTLHEWRYSYRFCDHLHWEVSCIHLPHLSHCITKQKANGVVEQKNCDFNDDLCESDCLREMTAAVGVILAIASYAKLSDFPSSSSFLT